MYNHHTLLANKLSSEHSSSAVSLYATTTNFTQKRRTLYTPFVYISLELFSLSKTLLVVQNVKVLLLLALLLLGHGREVVV